jgi:glycerate kinase
MRYAHADLVLTGEGRLDASTLHGKLVFRVLRAAKQRTCRWLSSAVNWRVTLPC